jgi:pimeloyl-ACP methyl ester carboxylesterase
MDQLAQKSNFVNVNGIRLHYLDWGGGGPALLFLAGMGCNAYIFEHLALRFTDEFHVLALTRRGHGDSDHPETGYDIDTLTEDILKFMEALGIGQAILVGHSMAGAELSHLAALYPERVLKLVYLDAAYDRSSTGHKALQEKSPWNHIQAPGMDVDHYSEQDYFAAMKRAFSSFNFIWTDWMEEQWQHEIEKTPEGKIVDRTSPAINAAINHTLSTYVPEDSKILAPILSFYAIDNENFFLDYGWMTETERSEIKAYFKEVSNPWVRQTIEQFRRAVPHARIVEIPQGHHYCFIYKEELVYTEMRKFLLE